MDFLDQYGPALGGAIIAILALVGVVRLLWRVSQAAQTALFEKVVEQYNQRILERNEIIVDKNVRIHELETEVRIERAEKEGMERLVQRGDDMLEASLTEAKAWRERYERLERERRRRSP